MSNGGMGRNGMSNDGARVSNSIESISQSKTSKMWGDNVRLGNVAVVANNGFSESKSDGRGAGNSSKGKKNDNCKLGHLDC